jgi:hypothetical protein
MPKITVYYNPKIDEYEKNAFKEIFSKSDISFIEYKIKGVLWGSIDVQIILDILSNDYLQALLTTREIVKFISSVVKRIFTRNNKKIMDNNTRPRYTNLTIRMEKKMITISNINPDGNITISKTSSDLVEIKKQIDDGNKNYSDEELEKYIYED